MGLQVIDVLLGVEDRELMGLILRCLEEQPLFRVRGTVSNAEDLGEALTRTNPHCVFLSDHLAEEVDRLPVADPLMSCLGSSLVFLATGPGQSFRPHSLPEIAGRLGFPRDGRDLFQQLVKKAGERSEASLRWLRRNKELTAGERGESNRALLLQGAKGGTGTTFLAARLAAFLAQDRDTLLIDFDLHGAGLSNLFDSPFRKCLTDVLHLGGEITSAALESVVRRHPAGFKLLSSPPEAERIDKLPAAGLMEALQAIFLRQDVTLIDVPHGLDDISASLHVICQKSLLVFTPDVMSIRSLERGLGLLRRLSLGGERLGLILNRSGPYSSIGAAQVEAYLRLPVLASFREDTAAGADFAEMGRLPSSLPLLKESSALADALGLPGTVPPATRRGRRFLTEETPRIGFLRGKGNA